MKRRKVCARGHVFYKSSDCPTCPTCEAAKRPADGFMAGLAAPALRQLGSARAFGRYLGAAIYIGLGVFTAASGSRGAK